jgi:hypothetical protein
MTLAHALTLARVGVPLALGSSGLNDVFGNVEDGTCATCNVIG